MSISCDEINQMPWKILDMCVCLHVGTHSITIWCRSLITWSQTETKNQEKTQTDKNTLPGPKLHMAQACVRTFLLLSFGWSGGVCCGHEVLNRQKWSAFILKEANNHQGLLPFQSTMTHLSPNLFLQIASTFHSLSELHLCVPSPFFVYMPPSISCTSCFIFSLLRLTISIIRFFFSQLFFSFILFHLFVLPLTRPSIFNHSIPESQSCSCQQLKWKRDECFSTKTLGGQNDTFGRLSISSATHCIIIVLISKICACPVSRKGDPDCKPGWDQ